MTLVANFSVEGHPVLIGDLILSKDGDTDKSFNVPLYSNPNKEIQGKIIGGLKQKVILLSSRFAVAWSGNAIEAELAINKLIEAYLDNVDYSVNSLNMFLDDRCGDYKDLYLTFIIILESNNNGIKILRTAWPLKKNKILTSEKYNSCYVGGSGVQDFADVLYNEELVKKKTNRSINPCENAVLSTLSIITKLSGEQMRIGKGLQELYGGGFEIVTLLNGCLVKVGEIVYCLMEAVLTKDKKIQLAIKEILKYSYDNKERLFIRRWVTNELFIILPIHQKLSMNDKVQLLKNYILPTFSAQFYGFYVYVPQANGAILNFLYYNGNGKNEPISVHENQGYDDVKLSPDLHNRVSVAIQKIVAV